jgi:hypothetical protein
MVLPVKADVRLHLAVDSVSAAGGQDSVAVPMYMTNYNDTIAGIELWLQLDRPDICRFKIYEDTIIDNRFWQTNQSGQPIEIDRFDILFRETAYSYSTLDTYIVWSVEFDTSGTLLSGWEYIAARSLAGTGTDAKIVALADYPLDKDNSGIPPRDTPGTLINLLTEAEVIFDTTQDRTAQIFISTFTDHFSFSDPQGNSIGITYDSVIEMQCFDCIEWAPPPDDTVCLFWQQLPPGVPGDSCFYDTVLVPIIDTSAVKTTDGYFTIIGCGDINDDGSINIIDITELIAYLYLVADPPPMYLTVFDVNHSGDVNILDIVYIIEYLYSGGSAPDCDGI